MSIKYFVYWIILTNGIVIIFKPTNKKITILFMYKRVHTWFLDDVYSRTVLIDPLLFSGVLLTGQVTLIHYYEFLGTYLFN